ncbi:FtsK/SpoIIIE family DNA translocase [Absicoccus intestinalis]|uniref:DNA translocase FtsK n=1 Tax=Absicoccus intestinalis TaxID=2926319 RepID=A0ABU4WRV7_9FIRM|nr:DNA translocase FtsK [Absicoccus sp. CLA-KB-P134]MDX8418197.1 DNA translocase FtsK [Absicoccus sp. CLA-KB-P134]
MANAKRKKRTRKKTTKKNQSTKKTQSNALRMCLLLFIATMAILATIQVGIVGAFLYHLVALFVGIFTIPVLILLIAVCLLQLIRFSFERIKPRYWIATGLFLMAGLLFVSIQEFAELGRNDWFGLQFIFGHFISILAGEVMTQGGLIGTLLFGLLGSMFDVVGSYIFAILFLLMSILLFSYDSLANLVNEPKKEKKPKKKRKPIIDQTWNDEEMDEDEPESLFIDADSKKEVSKSVSIPEPIDSADVKPMIETQPVEQPRTTFQFGEDLYKDYKLPSLNVLNPIEKKSKNNINASTAKEQGKKLIEILNEFGVGAELVQIHIGPSVTKFEIKPELGVRVNKISNLQYDIKMGLAATDIRVEAPIPGKNAVGIEIPNVEKTSVQMKDLMRGIPTKYADKKLLFCLGKDLMGTNVYGQLNRMPHLLIAGATGSGKSVCVNSIICSLLMRTRPDEVKLVLIDPKKVEFTPYQDVPHLLAPVITDGDMANKALKVIVNMMDHRYDVFGQTGVRNIAAYNKMVAAHPEEHLQPMPSIVVIIDELADLMLVAAKEVEASIQRITQLARAAGIHLVVATQRPSVDVITGVIKANIPSRIAFAVSQAVDSRTIIDQVGAERLLGYGDMLYKPNGETTCHRIQGVFITDEEVNRIAEYVKSQGRPQYDDAFIQLKDLASQGGQVKAVSSDPMYEDVKKFVIQSNRASTSLIQRRFSVGYSRAARLMDSLEKEGIIGPANGSKPRKILVHNTLEDESESV